MISRMEYSPNDILALLPLGAAIATAVRNIIGLPLIGVFAPALLALTILELGPAQGVAAMAVAGAGGLIAAPIVARLPLPRSSRLGLLLIAVATAVVGSGTLDGPSAGLPMVVLAVAAERTWEAARVEGGIRALRLAGWTMLTSLFIASVLQALAPRMSELTWLASAGVGVAATMLAGSYRGLRLTELWRFRRLLDEPGYHGHPDQDGDAHTDAQGFVLR